ncbi:hypothetical protein, partial [Xenorhabdus griffiniae]
MKIKTSALTGRALDWAVSMAVREDVNFLIEMSDVIPAYSISWNLCGQLIDGYIDDLTHMAFRGDHWVANCRAARIGDFSIFKTQTGDTLQIAICRAVVAAQLG